jgi:hypothetical protein
MKSFPKRFPGASVKHSTPRGGTTQTFTHARRSLMHSTVNTYLGKKEDNRLL